MCGAGLLVTKLWIKYPTAQAMSSMLPKFPMLQTLQMMQSDVDADHLQCFSSLPRLIELCLPHCFSSRSKLQPQHFTYLSQLTSLHLHFECGHRMTPEDLPGGMFQTLRKLQQVSITGMRQGRAPFVDLACLPELSSFCTDYATSDITLLSDLTKLHITDHGYFPVFEQSFGNLVKLTALHVGSKYGTSVNDIVSLHMFPKLANLVLQGPIKMSQSDPSEHLRQQSRWNALTSLTSVKHLELKEVDHTYKTFWTLGCMTQLTCLHFSSCNPFLKAQLLDEHLLGLSTLTCLHKLTCKFPCSSFQDKGYAHHPRMSAIGDLLRYSLSFCTMNCKFLFGCNCMIFRDVDVDSSRSSAYRSRYNQVRTLAHVNRMASAERMGM